MRKYFCAFFLAAFFLSGCVCSVNKDLQAFNEFLNSEVIAEHTGCRVYRHLPTKWAKDIYMINFCQLYANYEDNVDFTLRENMIVLLPATRKALYSAASVPPCRYVKGSRPVLEAIVNECKVDGDEQTTVLNIMRYCRDLHKKRYENQLNDFGGREEDMIPRGENLCEELARLSVALCEIAGIPGRIVMHIAGGHYTSEFYINGRWGWCDPRMGFYLLDEQGRLASVDDFMQDPSIIDKQSDEVKKDIVGYTTWEIRAARCRTYYSNPNELNCFAYYSLGDSGKYNYTIIPHQKAIDNGLMKYNAVYGKLIKETPQNR